jgi:hypothetical protein
VKIEDEPKGGCLVYLAAALLCLIAAQCSAAIRDTL